MPPSFISFIQQQRYAEAWPCCAGLDAYSSTERLR